VLGEGSEVLADGRPRQAEALRELARGRVVDPLQAVDDPALRLGERDRGAVPG
jgi:hypothetical protein